MFWFVALPFRPPGIFRFGRFADAVGAVQPAAEIDHLAPLAAEWAKGRTIFLRHVEDFSAGWAFERRHNENLLHPPRVAVRCYALESGLDLDSDFAGVLSFLSVLSFFSFFAFPSIASFSALAAFLYPSER